MLIVSKKKILLCRVAMWGGIVLAAVGAVMTYMESTGMECVILLAAGLLISLLGAAALARTFRCPKCKKYVLSSDNRLDMHTKNCPSSCPHCGTPVEIKD